MKQNKKAREGTGQLPVQQLAEKGAQTILDRQRKLANYLQRKTQYWDYPSKLIALAFFAVLFGGPFLYLLLKALR